MQKFESELLTYEEIIAVLEEEAELYIDGNEELDFNEET